MTENAHPELLLLTGIEPEHPLARSLASQLLEYGIFFEGLAEQEFPRRLPDDLSGYKAIAIDDVLIERLNDTEKKDLESAAAQCIVSCLPVASMLDLHRIGPMAKRIYDLHTVGHVLQTSIQAGLTRNHPQVARIQLGRDIKDSAGKARAGLMAYLTGTGAWHRGWHEHTLHYWMAAVRLLREGGDPELHEALTTSIRDTSKSMPVGLFQDQLGGLFGTVWLYEQTGESGPMERARACMDSILARRPRLDGIASGSGFTDDPLLLRVPERGGGRYAGFTSRRELIFTEILHMMSASLAALSRGTGDEKYLDEALRLFRYIQAAHVDANGLICQCSHLGVPASANWSRGAGHALIGVSYLLDEMPADHPARAELLAFLQRAAAGLCRVQDPQTGLWRNVLDHAEARLESSGTSTFTHVFARALNEGWIEGDEIAGMVRLGARGLKRLVWRGGLSASCRGTALGDPAYYIGRPQGWTAAPGLGSIFREVERTDTAETGDP